MYQIQLQTEEEVALLIAAARLGSVKMGQGESPVSELVFLASPPAVHKGVVKALRDAMQSINASHSSDPRRN